MNFTQIVTIGSFFITIFLIIRVSGILWKFKFPTLRMLFLGILLVLLAEIFPVFEIFGWSFGESVINYAISFTLRPWALLLILLVFEAIREKTPFTRRNLLMGIIVAVLTTGLCVSGVIVYLYEPEFYSRLGELSTTGLEDFSGMGMPLIVVFLFFLFSSALLVLSQLIVLFYRIDKKRREEHSIEGKQVLLLMEVGEIFIIIGSAINASFPLIGETLNIVGFVVMIWSLYKKGHILFSGGSLRLLIVMNQDGIPVYTFNFKNREEGEERGENYQRPLENGEEVLFSGVLKAISMLMEELTGADQVVREIQLDRTVVLVSQSKERDVSVLLFTDYPTRILYDALNRFCDLIFTQIKHESRYTSWSDQEVLQGNQWVDELFGLN